MEYRNEKREIRGLVAWQFDHVHNLTDKGYKASLKMISEQVIVYLLKKGWQPPAVSK